MANIFRLISLYVLTTIFILLIGSYTGGREGILIAFFILLLLNISNYLFSDRIILRIYRAQEACRDEASYLYEIVSELSETAGLPMPKIYIMPLKAPNAFATGRNPKHAVLAVTQGLLDILDKDELTGVLAHELSHVKNRDILIGSVAAAMALVIMLFADMIRIVSIFSGSGASDYDEVGDSILGLIVMAILAPVAALLIQMAVFQTREYQADDTGAGLAGNSEGLANALEKIGLQLKENPMYTRPSTAHMFIVNSLSDKFLMRLFSTHPPLEKRIARLRAD